MSFFNQSARLKMNSLDSSKFKLSVKRREIECNKGMEVEEVVEEAVVANINALILEDRYKISLK
jgi:hypothetical protein